MKRYLKLFLPIILYGFLALPFHAEPQNTKVSALPAVGAAPVGTDEMYIVDGGVSKKVTVTNLGLGILSADSVGESELLESMNFTTTGIWDFSTGTLDPPHSTTLPATCTPFSFHIDEDATTGQRLYLCETTDTWVLQGGSATVNTADIADVSVTQTELAELETIGATSISSGNWTGLSNLSGSNTGDDDVPESGDFGNAVDLETTGAVSSDSINLAELDDAADTPVAGECLKVAAGATDVEYSACGGSGLPVVDTTSIAEGSADATKEVRFEVDGITTGTIRVLTMPDEDVDLGNLQSSNYGTGSVNGTAIGVGAVSQSEIADNQITYLEIQFPLSPAGNPGLGVDECFWSSSGTGGGFLCEGSTADTNEQLYKFPNLNGADTTEFIVIADDANVSAAEAGQLDGVTSPIQTQLDLMVETIEIDTEGELETVSNITNILRETEIDASSELLAIMDDESGTGLLTFGTSATHITPLLSGKIDADAGAVNDDDCTGEQGLFWYDDTDLAFEFCNANSGAPTVFGGGASLPVTDTTSIAEGSADATKEVRFEVDGITTGTVRVLTMPDEDIDLGNFPGDNIVDGSIDETELGASSVRGSEIINDGIDFVEIEYSNTLGSNPAFAADECFWASDISGASIICEGSTADLNEQKYRFPDVNGADTTEFFIIADDANVSSVEAGWLDGVTSSIQTQIDGKEAADTDIAKINETEVITGDWDFSGGGIEIENGITPPACTEGQLFLDTDATAGQQLLACDAGTFVLQGDGGGAETNDLEANDPPNVADAEVYVGTGAGAGAWIAGLAACAADEKIEYVPGAPDTFTCEAIGSLVDADVANNITIDLSTLATTLTITDNEATAETNAVLFTSAGDLDGGNLGIESDGTLNYTPSTGILDATDFTEGGIAVFNNDEIDASSELLAIMDDETGTGLLVFGTAPTFTTSMAFGDAFAIVDGNGNQQVIFQQTASAVNEIEITNAATGNGPQIKPTGGDTNIDLVLGGKGTGYVRGLRHYPCFRVVAHLTDVTAATDRGGDFRIPFGGTIIDVRGYVNTAGTTGTMVVDIHKNGTTIMTTDKIDIETTEKSSKTAATQPALTTTTVADDDIMTIDIDTIQTTAAKGLTVCLTIEEN